MSMTLAQQQEMAKAMYDLERELSRATMSHRVCMVLAEALRQKLCYSREEVERLMDVFARENAATIRNELQIECHDGVWTPVGVSASSDPSNN